jgi:hypothetical protein
MAELTPSQENAIADRIADGITRGMEALRPKKVSPAEYAKRVSKRRPNGNRGPKLKNDYYQNGYKIDTGVISDDEIKLLNQIHRPGRYIERRVEVVARYEGSEQYIDIRYPNGSIDQQLENKSHWRNFADLLRQIVTEQAELDEQESNIKALAAQVGAETRPARESFSSKATREAREKAGE